MSWTLLVAVLLWSSPSAVLRAEEPASSPTVKALKAILSAAEVGADDEFRQYREKHQLQPESIAPKGFRTLLLRPDLQFGNTGVGMMLEANRLELTWWSDTATEQDVAGAARTMREQMEKNGFQEAEPPSGRRIDRDLRLMQRLGKELLLFEKLSEACQEQVFVAVVERDARPESKVRVAIRWRAKTSLAESSLALKEVFTTLPMLKGLSVDSGVLDAVSSAPVVGCDVQLQSQTSNPLPISAVGLPMSKWTCEIAADIRPMIEPSLVKGGYTLTNRTERLRGSVSENWTPPDDLDRVSLNFSTFGDRERSRLTVSRAYTPAPNAPMAETAPPPAAAPLPPGPSRSPEVALQTLLQVAEVGTDDGFNAHRSATGLSDDAIAPKGMRTLLVRPDFGFGTLNLGVHQIGGYLMLRWGAEAQVDLEVAEARSEMQRQLEALGFSRTDEAPQEPYVKPAFSLLQRRAKELLVFRKTAGETRELVLVPIVDRDARPQSKVGMGVQWFVMTAAPEPLLSCPMAVKAIPALKPLELDPSVLDVFETAPPRRFERTFSHGSSRTRSSVGPLIDASDWGIETAGDLRPALRNALTGVGYTLVPETERAFTGGASETWSRDTDDVTLFFVAAPPGSNQTPFLNVRSRRKEAPGRLPR